MVDTWPAGLPLPARVPWPRRGEVPTIDLFCTLPKKVHSHDMSDAATRVRIASVAEVLARGRKLCSAAGREVALFHVEGKFLAVDNRCPHAGGPLIAGGLHGQVIGCPWHDWRFDLCSGQGVDNNATVRTYAVVAEGEDLWMELPPEAPQPDEAGIFHYLVRYGAAGTVGRFGSIEQHACRRGDWVLVQTQRGVALGELLAGPQPPGGQRAFGEMLGVAGEDDLRRHAALRQAAESQLEAARCLIERRGLPVTLVDAEVTLQPEAAWLTYLGEPCTTLGVVAAALGEQGLAVRFLPIE